MIEFKAFEAEVLQYVKDDRWLHILPSVPEDCRLRFISAIQAGVAMPFAFDLVLVSKHMKDNEFEKKLEEITVR